MTIPPKRRAEIDIREEVDIVRIDPLFVERQRNKYASRGVALVVLLNGVAAIVLLVALAHGTPTTANLKAFADAMMVFGVGAALGLTSAFVAYLSRTFRLERPELLTTWQRPLRWLAVAAAIAGTACFLGGLNMARLSVLPDEKVQSAREYNAPRADLAAATRKRTAGTLRGGAPRRHRASSLFPTSGNGCPKYDQKG